MSSTEFTTEKTFYIDPVNGSVQTYRQFVSDLECDSAGGESSSAYATICELVSSIVRGNDFCNAEGRIEIQRHSELEKGSSKTVTSAIPLLFDSPIAGASARPLPGDWLQAIRGSDSRIQLATSGTTGQPRHVVHSVETLTRGVRTGEHHEHDVWGLAYPLDHLAGLQVLFQALFNRNTIVRLFGLPTEMVHEAIEKYGITHLSCTPTFLKLLATDAHCHVAVKRLTTGGERSDTATLSAVRQLFPNAQHRNIYALTEVGNLLVANGDQFTVPSELQDRVTVIDGSLAIHLSLLADRTIERVGDQDISDIKSANPARNSSDWYLTGDLVEILDEQPLTFKFLARRDDVINVGGYKVVPQQVEECLMKLPPVQQAVVYGRKNSVTGQIVVCDVVLEPGSQLDPVEAKQRLAEELPRYSVPRIINIVKTLRMTPTGKLCRRDETSL